jgi:hypothetical protein
VLAPYLQPNWIISEEEPPCSLGAMQIILQMLHEKAPCQMQPIESLEQHAQAEDDEGVYVCVVAVFLFFFLECESLCIQRLFISFSSLSTPSTHSCDTLTHEYSYCFIR